MCTTISQQVELAGSGKGPVGWFAVDRASLAYDHPAHAPLDHAVLIDVMNRSGEQRVALELTKEAARNLAQQILATVERADRTAIS